MIDLEAVTYSYPGTSSPALQDVSLTIDEGEYILIAGVSGSGKSTLLRCLNGLVPHFHGGALAGSVTVDGRDTRRARVRDLARTVGLVFQDPENQFITTSVGSEIAFGQENLGAGQAEAEARTIELGAQFGLERILGRPPGMISGGEGQKAIVASVVAMGTRVVGLDEPTSQLDPRSASQILDQLDRLNEGGITVILSEHRIGRILPRVTRVLVLEDGRLVLDGSPKEFVDRFSHLFSLEKATRPSIPRSTTRMVVRNLHFKYPGREEAVFDGLDLELRSSEILGVMGPNGSGKTTLARILAGLSDDYEGTIMFEGRDLRAIRRHELSRLVGLVFQNPNKHLFHETVLEEVEFAGRTLDLDTIPRNTLSDLGLEEFSERNPRDLSGGQKQKVAIASVMAHDPCILILDEPTRGLDLPEKAEIMLRLRQLVEERKTSFLLMTHDHEIVSAFADRGLVLSGGRAGFVGDPGSAADLFARCADE